MSDAMVGKHKVVSIVYQIRDEAGDILEQIDYPVSYVHGGPSDLIEKVENSLEGATVGDSVEVVLEPDEAFGPLDPSLTFTDDLENVPEQFRHVGAEVEMQNDQGDSRTFTVARIEDGKLTVDGNHPMAGRQVTFIVTVVEIRDATEAEIKQGVTPMTQPVLH
ncbi:MAG TPA: peptidylprolyl isomerase [Gammaproteobacteria bacterium]